MKEASITVENVQLNYIEKGTGKPVVCIHGNPGSATDFDLEEQESVKLIAFDRPGHGKSKRYVASDDHLIHQVRLMSEAINTVAEEPVTLVGHSWGAFIALAMAATNPEKIEKLVLLAPMVYPRQSVDSPKSGLVKLMQVKGVGNVAASLLSATAGKKAIHESMTQGFQPCDMPEIYKQNTLPTFTTPAAFKAICEDKADFEYQVMDRCKHYRTITTQTLIVCGDLDSVSEKGTQAMPLSKTLPNVELMTLANTGHQIPLTNRKELSEILAS